MGTSEVVVFVIATLLVPDVLAQSITTQPPASAADCICKPNDEVCRCTFIVEHRLTMILDGKELVHPDKGILRLSGLANKNRSLTPAESSRVITADGETSRLLIAINGQFPGPRVEVYKDQTLEINVTNKFNTDSITIHFHGLHQIGTPWMDGVAFVTQCPILPGQSFVYSFKATPAGTSMYHAHIGDQRSMGLYGPVIVRVKSNIRPYSDIVVTLQDWNHLMDSETAYHTMLTEQFDFTTGEKIPTTYSNDGGKFSRFVFHSGLVNGKGRFWYNSTTNNGAPLEVFRVWSGEIYRLRIVGAMTLYPLRFYIPTQKFQLFGSDGFDLEQIPINSIVVHPGERYDVLWQTPGSPSSKQYALVAESIEAQRSLGNKYHAAEAIVEVIDFEGGIDPFPPKPPPESCTKIRKCAIFNCPYRLYRNQENICIDYNDVKNNDPIRNPQLILNGHIGTEYFFNFGFPGFPGDTPGSVNGRQFIFPTSTMLSQSGGLTRCDETKCSRDGICSCTYTENLPYNSLIQMTLTNIGNGSGWSHPVHLHGHSFYVMKIGFGTYDETTGLILNDTEDITCIDKNNFCTRAKWTNESWNNGNIPGMNDDPPEKDTIIVPTGGYVVIRFISDNPGAWFLHCHIDLHNTNGMGMVLLEAPDKIPAPPPGFPNTCSNFPPAEGSAVYTSNRIGVLMATAVTLLSLTMM